VRAKIAEDLRLPTQPRTATRKASMVFNQEPTRRGYGLSTFELPTE
jgi:hypothetical protein